MTTVTWNIEYIPDELVTLTEEVFRPNAKCTNWLLLLAYGRVVQER